MKTKQPRPSGAKQNDSEMTGARRMDALGQLLRCSQFKESFTLSVQPSLRLHFLAGLQAATTAVISLALFQLSPWAYLLGFAVLGAPVALFGRFATRRRRTPLVFQCALLQVGAVFVMSVASWLMEPVVARLVILALLSGLFFFISIGARLGMPGPLIFVFAASASMGTPTSWQAIIEQTSATGVVAGLAVLICYLTEIVRVQVDDGIPFQMPLQSLRDRMLAAARVVAGAAAAMLLALALSASHPGWAAVGLVAVMQGSDLRINMNRAVQRTIGTACGALIAWPILAQHPSVWVMISILAFFMFVTEIIIGWNYALGQLSVTPMALIMSQLPTPNAITVAVVPERILDTLLGAAVAIAIAVLCSTLADRMHLANHRYGKKTGP
ncbi:FUSC family protein [Rhizobium herbae]